MLFDDDFYTGIGVSCTKLTGPGIDAQYRVTVSSRDLLETSPEYILRAICEKVANKFIEDHYSEIEKMIDVKVVAAIASAHMGAKVEKEIHEEIDRINSVAQDALRRSKKRV